MINIVAYNNKGFCNRLFLHSFPLLVVILFSLLAQSQSSAMYNQKLDSVFSPYFKPDEPGGAVMLVKDGEVIYKKCFGIADKQTKEVITSQTLFNIGSITKTFVAYGLLNLAKQGKLSLNDDLYKYFPDFKNKAIAQKVRLYHLLTHTSGLPDVRKVDEEREFYLTAKDEENWAPIKQTDMLQFEPGTKYKYSNPAFNGLALIIEKVSGKKWQTYIADLIFKPAGMKKSTITDGAHPAKAVSHAYVKNAKGGFDELDYGEEPTFAAAGNGGVWSNVEELWKYEQAIQQFIFLDKEWIGRSRFVYPFADWKEETPSRLGLSWFITKDSNGEMIGHTGSQGGFVSDYCWWPDQRTFYVLLCNIPRPVKEIREKLLAVLQSASAH
jgi:CubicO group peptidase (beta-lactamase class C family)